MGKLPLSKKRNGIVYCEARIEPAALGGVRPQE
jgi:hypothetical protein